jgi:hypothetical protein
MKKHGYFASAALAVVLAAAPVASAFAQGMPMPGFKLGEEKQLTPEEKEKMEANERAAKAAQSSIPTPKASNDPWATVRTNETPASTSKPKKSKTVQ